MAKRKVNGMDIKKVFYKDVQIWGEGIVPPPVDYHVISDFGGGYPTGWGGGGGATTGCTAGGAHCGLYSGDGSASRGRWSAMPSLANAIRIKIVYEIYVNGTSDWDGSIMLGSSNSYTTTMDSSAEQTITIGGSSDDSTILNYPAGVYTVTTEINLEERTATQHIQCPSTGYTQDLEISFPQSSVSYIRRSNSFLVNFSGSTVIQQIDFYVYVGHSSQEWVPEGYTMNTEQQYTDVMALLNSIGAPSSEWYKYLHIPLVGFCQTSSPARTGVGQCTYVWTSTPNSNDVVSRYITTSGASMYRVDLQSYGQPVRAFKNEYVTPGADWITEYGTPGGAGIFWSPDEELISIADGNGGGITLSDRFLGATIPWSYGDEYNDANCGLTYQWGNCYGFPYSGGYATSTEQVDTTGYGSGNYYSRPVYVIGHSNWANPQNDSLWP